jgi:adenylate cyclase
MRVLRTFAFLDLSGFTAFTETHGDTAAVEVVAHLRATIRSAAQSSGVRVAKWLGDGVMLTGIGAPAILGCAASVRDVISEQGRLPIRGGICEGHVIMFEGDDYVGAVVNVAAGLCARAQPGQLLTTASTASGAPVDLLTVEVRPSPIPGLVGDVEVVALERLRSDEDRRADRGLDHDPRSGGRRSARSR